MLFRSNVVYFEVSSSTTSNQTQSILSVSTTAKTVSVGVVMGVTPQINEDGRVTLTVRPTVSRVLRFKDDPNPALAIPNRVPEVQVREMESVLQVGTGQTVIPGIVYPASSRVRIFGHPGIEPGVVVRQHCPTDVVAHFLTDYRVTAAR